MSDSLAKFVKDQFGKLDILVNNAGFTGVVQDADARDRLIARGYGKQGVKPDYKGITTETWELAEECINTNYYGPKMMVEALVDLLQLSDSPRIVNISSNWARLENLSNALWAKKVFADVKKLNEEKLDEIVKEFLKDFRHGLLLTKRWPDTPSAYITSKMALNAYTFVIAYKYPSILVNSVCPGFVRTDFSKNLGNLSVEEGAETIVRIVLLPKGGSSGCFFRRKGRDPIISRI